uniref:Peroxidase n=1 Tax=Araucaria cunninghamii TaxID=56994 RepID=A0A0D6R6S1_ARACU
MASFFRFMVTWWIMVMFLGYASAWLRPNHYNLSCPSLQSIVKSTIELAVAKEPRIGASILRLQFHDCFVQGCDASVLLDGPTTEKTAVPNNNSARGFEVIDSIKSKVEAACSGIVSCADILTLAARDSVVALGGPTWVVALGRRDSLTANASLANTRIPAPTVNFTNLTKSFQNQGLSVKDLVVLAGGHTIGQARCTSFRGHIYNDTNIDPSFAKSRQTNCPQKAPSGDANLAPLDRKTPNLFDNNYFKNLLVKKGLLHSDQEIYNGVSTDSLVKTYANDVNSFFADFATSMVKMGNIQPLLGTRGEIRKNCRKPN